MAFCGAIDSRLKDQLVLGKTRDVAAMRNPHKERDTRTLGAQVYYMLDHGDDCWTSTSQGLQCGSVRYCRNCFTANLLETRERRWDEFEVLLRKYSAK